MGCFNKTGFFSHLPITYGDEIVLFVCADTDTGKNRKDDTPIRITSSGLVPVAMPFFGKFNDYGGIEDVVDDANHQYFKEKVGMGIDVFCDIMADQSGLSIESMTKAIESIKNGNDDENEYHYETVEDYEKGINMLKTIFGFEPKKMTTRNSNNDVQVFLERMYQDDLYKFNNASLVCIMEHKSVYDKMVEVGKNTYSEDWVWYRPVKPEEAFDFTVNFIKENNEELADVNPLQFGVGALHKVDLPDNGKDARKNMYLIFGSHCILYDTVYVDDFDHCLYNGIGASIEPMKELACNYVYFLSAFKSTCTTFNLSPYHHQSVAYDMLIPIFEEILDTLKKQAHKYDE
jgi:hypothetical protein